MEGRSGNLFTFIPRLGILWAFLQCEMDVEPCQVHQMSSLLWQWLHNLEARGEERSVKFHLGEGSRFQSLLCHSVTGLSFLMGLFGNSPPAAAAVVKDWRAELLSALLGTTLTSARQWGAEHTGGCGAIVSGGPGCNWALVLSGFTYVCENKSPDAWCYHISANLIRPAAHNGFVCFFQVPPEFSLF